MTLMVATKMRINIQRPLFSGNFQNIIDSGSKRSNRKRIEHRFICPLDQDVEKSFEVRTDHAML